MGVENPSSGDHSGLVSGEDLMADGVTMTGARVEGSDNIGTWEARVGRGTRLAPFIQPNQLTPSPTRATSIPFWGSAPSDLRTTLLGSAS